MKKALICSLLSAAVLLLQTIGSYAQSHKNDNDTFVNQPSGEIQETKLNTASMKFSDGITYKLVLIGDLLPQLWMNGNRIVKNDLPYYEEQLEQLKKVLADRQQEQWKLLNAVRERVKKQVIADILARKLLASEKEFKSYYLTNFKLVINDKVQEPAEYHFFRDKYVKSPDTVLYYDRESNVASPTE